MAVDPSLRDPSVAAFLTVAFLKNARAQGAKSVLSGIRVTIRGYSGSHTCSDTVTCAGSHVPMDTKCKFYCGRNTNVRRGHGKPTDSARH